MGSGLSGPATASVLPLEQVIWEGLKAGKFFLFNLIILCKKFFYYSFSDIVG
jgi:hypothetical protein